MRGVRVCAWRGLSGPRGNGPRGSVACMVYMVGGLSVSGYMGQAGAVVVVVVVVCCPDGQMGLGTWAAGCLSVREQGKFLL